MSFSGSNSSSSGFVQGTAVSAVTHMSVFDVPSVKSFGRSQPDDPVETGPVADEHAVMGVGVARLRLAGDRVDLRHLRDAASCCSRYPTVRRA